MTTERANEYMRNVKWTTAGAAMSVIVSLVWFAADIKEGIKDNRSQSHIEIITLGNTLTHKIDSNQYQDNLQFQDIKSRLTSLEKSANTVHTYTIRAVTK